MNKITVSAPGKLMLFGEHAVVYNRPCIVTAVDQRMFVTIERSDSGLLELEAPDVKVYIYSKKHSEIGKGDIPKGVQFVEIAVKNILQKYKVKITGLKIVTRSEFSSQFGFGSSSASTVCVVLALSKLFGLNLTKKEIFDTSYKTVLDIQGKGSGFDVAAAVWGGTLYFFTGGKIIKPLKMKELPLIVGYSGIKADTVTLINHVQEKAGKYPKIIDGIYSLIEKIVKQAKVALVNNDWKTVGELMNLNQGLLESLGVSIDTLSQLIYAANDNGAYGAKLSGAGGGDCMIAFSNSKNKKVIEEGIKKSGGEVIQVKTQAEGVRIEK